MRVLFDTDVLLDLFLDRLPFADAAAQLWASNENGEIEGYVSAITPLNIFYIARKLKGASETRQAVAEIVSAFRICPIDRSILQAAFTLPIADYEDATQAACAQANQLDALVTRNGSDYEGAIVAVLSPLELLQRLGAT